MTTSASQSLVKACRMGDVPKAKQALENGADPNFSKVKGGWFVPLVYAVRWDSLKLVTVLLESGADVNRKSINGWNALHAAVFYAHSLTIIETLLRAGADPNQKNAQGDTVIHCSQSIKVMKLLVTAGADLRLRNRHNETPIQRLRFRLKKTNELDNVFLTWTPHKMLPRWTPPAFHQYCEECSGFRDAIQTLMLCLVRYRYLIARQLGLEIVEYVAEMHRKEVWWPAWENFDMTEYT